MMVIVVVEEEEETGELEEYLREEKDTELDFWF